MGVFTRPNSPYYRFYNEATKEKVKTDLRTDAPSAALRKQNLELATALWQQAVTAANAAKVAAVLNPEAAAAAAQPARPRITFDAFAAWYEAHVSSKKRGGRRERRILETLRATFGPRWLDEITSADVDEWETARLATCAAPTVYRETGVLKHLFVKAVPKYLAASPIAGRRDLRRPKTTIRVLSLDEERRLLDACTTPSHRALLTLAIDSLIRLNDAIHLRREHDHGTYLVVVDPKVEQYEVPVSSRVRKALDALPAHESGYYFPERLVAKNPEDWRSIVRNILRRACKRAKVPYGRGKGITFHALRHTGASRMVDRGVNLRVVQAIGGWQNLTQLQRYAHPTEHALRAAVESISAPAPAPKLRIVKGRKRRVA